jgi:hypothetical protein
VAQLVGAEEEAAVADRAYLEGKALLAPTGAVLADSVLNVSEGPGEAEGVAHVAAPQIISHRTGAAVGTRRASRAHRGTAGTHPH